MRQCGAELRVAHMVVGLQLRDIAIDLRVVDLVGIFLYFRIEQFLRDERLEHRLGRRVVRDIVGLHRTPDRGAEGFDVVAGDGLSVDAGNHLVAQLLRRRGIRSGGHAAG